MKRLLTSITVIALAQCAALGQGKSVAVLFNSKLPESKAVAEHYAKVRDIPANHLIGLPLSDGHTISRREFTVKLEQPLAAELARRNLLDGKAAFGDRFEEGGVAVADDIAVPVGTNEGDALRQRLRRELRRIGLIHGRFLFIGDRSHVNQNQGFGSAWESREAVGVGVNGESHR